MPEVIEEEFPDGGASKLKRLAKELLESARKAEKLANEAVAILQSNKTASSRPQGRDSDMRRWTLLNRIRRKN
jgi:molybdenum-dependent DNA-binding transcriptional regulator ModE